MTKQSTTGAGKKGKKTTTVPDRQQPGLASFGFVKKAPDSASGSVSGSAFATPLAPATGNPQSFKLSTSIFTKKTPTVDDKQSDLSSFFKKDLASSVGGKKRKFDGSTAQSVKAGKKVAFVVTDDEDSANDTDDDADDEVLSGAELEMLQGEFLEEAIADWVRGKQERGETLRPEDSNGLGQQFTDTITEVQFAQLPQSLRQDDDQLHARCSGMVADLLRVETTEADDTKVPSHTLVWHTLVAKLKIWRSKTLGTCRYESFLTRYDSDDLLKLTEQCTETGIWEECVVKQRISPECMDGLPASADMTRPGWYYIHMWNADKQVWEWSRRYVGQAGAGEGGRKGKMTTGRRCNIHITSSRNLKALELLYQAWRNFEPDLDHMNQVKFVNLGVIEEAEKFFDDPADLDLYLNLVEMYFGLVFRSLQKRDLERWLPKAVTTVADQTKDLLLQPLGLNNALPIHQGVRGDAVMYASSLVHSADPKVAEMARARCDRNLQKVRDDNWMVNTQALRAAGKMDKENILRSGTTSVRVACADCGWEKDDDTPRYIQRTGEYLMRRTPCRSGEHTVTDAVKKKGGKHPLKMFRPAGRDAGLKCLSDSTLSNRLNAHANSRTQWREYYTGIRLHLPTTAH